MKRLLLTIAFCLLISHIILVTSFAGTPVTDLVGVFNAGAGKFDYQSYSIANLMNKGEPVQTDMPAVLMQGRTMVPVRVISEGLGASVDWINKTQQVEIRSEDLHIMLTIGSPNASVNGENVTLPDGVPAILAKYDGSQRTLVPLRFVAEQMGADVEWDGESRTAHIDKPPETVEPYQVTKLKEINEQDTFVIMTSGEASYDVKYIDEKLVLDFFYAEPGDILSVPKLKNTWIDEVNYSRYNGYPDIDKVVRIELKLKGDAESTDLSVDETPDGIVVAVGEQTETVKETDKTEIIDNTAKKGNTVVIDPGHGGIDPGAVSGKYHEADVNMAVALRVRNILQKAEIQVIMTRSDDAFLSLSGRAACANKINCDVYVSIHANASDSRYAKGIETFYFAPSSSGKALADSIQDSVIQKTNALSRGIKSANFFVLRETNMTSALIETGFITNSADRELLFNESYRDRLAEGIAGGILKYLGVK